jgi:hypothetical protein
LIFSINAQTVYTGFIGNYPVEMVIYPYGKLADATYSYTNFDEPISLDNGKINNGHLIFQEKENSKRYLTINNFLNPKITSKEHGKIQKAIPNSKSALPNNMLLMSVKISNGPEESCCSLFLWEIIILKLYLPKRKTNITRKFPQ